MPQKVRMFASEEPPCLKNTRTGQPPLLRTSFWTAPYYYKVTTFLLLILKLLLQ